MTDEDQMFANLQAEMFSDHASGLLDRQLKRARTWLAQRKGNGETATLYDLTRHCLKEPNKRRHIIAAYCAALLRIIEMEDERERAIDEGDWA